MTRHQSPDLPEPELHKPELSESSFTGKPTGEIPGSIFVADPNAPGVVPLPLNPQPSDFEMQSWGPRGNEFARFRLAGDCEVVIYHAEPGGKQIAVEIITGNDYRKMGGADTRRSTALQLPKARARALASAIMGAAAEL